MNYKKRALRSIFRRKGKSLILFAVLFILGNVIAGAISIQQATTNVENIIKQRLGAKATFEPDFMKYTTENPKSTTLPDGPSLDEIKKAGELTYVKKYDYNVNTYITTDKLKTYSPEKKEGGLVEISGSPNTVTLKGVNYAPLLDLEEKTAKMVDGRTFTKEEVESGKQVAVISKKFAEENSLHVGDNMVIDNTVYSYDENQQKNEIANGTRDVPLEVIGIFEPIQNKKKDSSDNAQQDMMKELYQTEYLNTIYVPNKVSMAENQFIKSFGTSEESKSETTYSPTYVLKSPEDAEAFKEEMQPLMPKYYNVKASTDQYDSIAGPIKSMEKMSKYVLIASVIASLFIITLVVLLFLRDRKHELGVYLSLGERRTRIVGQILIEVLLVAFVAITLSVFSGNMLARGVSSSLLQSQGTTSEQASESQQIMLNPNDVALSSDLDQSDVNGIYQVTLSASFILIFYLVGIVTVLLSIVVPLLYILKLNPKKIML